MFQAPFSKSSRQYRSELQSTLEDFYNNFAKPAKVARLDDLREVVNEIIHRVRDRDPRFDCTVHDAGSVASGVSAVVACEFDILLCLDIDGSDEESELSPGFAKFKLRNSSAKLWSDAVTGRYLNPRKITDIFQSHVDEVVKGMRGDLDGDYTVGGQGTVATTVAIKENEFKYKADLVLAVKCSGWPSSANPDWLQRGYAKEWPSQETISKIMKNGYELVAKYVNENTPGVGDRGRDLELLWRLSVSRAETLLLKTITGPEKSLCHKKCLIIFKALRLHHLVRTSRGIIPNPDMTILLTSYHFKTLLFHEALAHPSSEWTNDKLVDRFLDCLATIHCRIAFEDNMSPFFFPDVNLFKNRAIMLGGSWERMLVQLHEDPRAYIQSIMPIDPSSKYMYSYF